MPASPRSAGSILALNAGSSSLKFATYAGNFTTPRTAGMIEAAVGTGDEMISVLATQVDLRAIVAAGHRVVFSARRGVSAPVTPALLDEFRRATAADAEHLPASIALIEALLRRRPDLPQFACFDAAFHDTIPAVARMLPIPARFDKGGIERIGFHGLSCAYLISELSRIAGEAASRKRVIIAHLGGGSSITAVHDGRSVDTSMGFTPAGGLPMATRTGDLDPGVVIALARETGGDWRTLNVMLNHRAGLLGIAGTTGDMRLLLAQQDWNPRAALAVEFFCYHARKWIGAFAAALGGIDTLIFAGGIGENAPEIRRRIIEPLAFLGLEVDADRNTAAAPVISGDDHDVVIRVIRTDEASMIARIVSQAVHSQT